MDLEGAEVSGSVSFRGGTHVTGIIDLRAKVGVSVDFSLARVEAVENQVAVIMCSANISDSVTFVNRSHITGRIDLRANVGGQVEFRTARIEAAAASKALDMSSAKVAGSVFIRERTHVTGRIDLRAEVGHQVSINNSMIETSDGMFALDMEGADVSGSFMLNGGTIIKGGLFFHQALFRKGLYTTSNPFTENTDLPKTKLLDLELLVMGNIRMTYVVVHGPAVFHRARLCGRLQANHLNVQGDLDIYSCVIGNAGSTDSTNTNVSSEEDRTSTTPPTELIHGPDSHIRIPKSNQHTHPLNQGIIQVFTDELILDLTQARINGSLLLKNSKLYGSADMEGIKIDGKANFEWSEFAGHLKIRSAEIVGMIFAEQDEKSNLRFGTHPRVLGHVDLSYSRTSQVDIKLVKGEESFHPTYVNMTGATVGRFLLRGNSEIDRDSFDRRGLLVTDGMVFLELDIDEDVYRHPSYFKFRDRLRLIIWAASLLILFGVISNSGFDIMFCTISLLYLSLCVAASIQSRYTHSSTSPILSMLHHTFPFSRGFYINVENWFRNNGESSRGDEVFLMRRRRETRPPGITPSAMIDFEKITVEENKPLSISAFERRMLISIAGKLVVLSLRISRLESILFRSADMKSEGEGKAACNSSDDSEDQSIISGNNRIRRIIHGAGIRTFELAEKLHEIASPTPRKRFEFMEDWPTPRLSRRVWSWFVDFVFGFGVRWSRLVHLFILLFLINIGLFLNPESVEHPLSFIQPRTLSDTGEVKEPYWSTNGGKPDASEWGFSNAAFMTLRVQVPLLALAAENDWEPSSRSIDFGIWKLFRIIGFPITYEEWASLMMAVNFVLIPLIVAGLTQQFRTHGSE